jgi:hypothetical protein
LEAANAFSEITGSLRLAARSLDGVTEVDLVNLRSLGGDLLAQGTPLVRLALPNLSELAGELNLQANAELSEVDLRGLQTLGAGLTITDNPQLARARLDSLTTVAGSIQVSGALLPLCEVQALYDRLEVAEQATGTACSCTSDCGWLEVVCP